MKLTDKEKKYLYSKLEYNKRKKSKEKNDKLYQLLNGDGNTFSKEDLNMIIKSLEFTFRKRLMNGPDLPNENYKSIKSKLPEDIILVKQSSITTKPTKSWLKSDIVKYLKSKKIEHDPKDTKDSLIKLLENKVLSFDEYNGMNS